MRAHRLSSLPGTTRAAILAACAALALAPVRGAADSTCLLASADFDRARATSAACLSCHDGSCASAVSGDRSHPVDRAYASGWLRGTLSLRSIPARELVLSAGVVTCATCHDGRSGLPHHTAMPQARICEGCHMK
jgi:formate-dependent nitrite reductase cytochrome c552 subunit